MNEHNNCNEERVDKYWICVYNGERVENQIYGCDRERVEGYLVEK